MKKVSRLLFMLALVTLSLSVAPLVGAQGGLPVATLVCAQNMYDQPDETSAALAALGTDEPVMLVTGRDVTGDWLVVLRQTGQVGWTKDSDCVRLQGQKTNAPLTVPAGYDGPPFATIGCTQYLRSEPSQDSAALLVLYPEDGALQIKGRDEQVVNRNTVSNWLLVEREDGAMGWVYDPAVRYADGTVSYDSGSPCIRVRGNVFELPVTSDISMPVPNPDGTFPPTLETDLPTATIGCTQYIRSAPNNDAARLAILYPDDGVLEILGRDRIAEWLLIRSQSGLMGWVVDTQCIVVQDNAFDAPITIDVRMPIPGVDDVVFDEATAAEVVAGVEGEVPVTPVVEVPLPNADVACTQYVRSAANNDAARLMIFYPGDGPLEILARDQVGEWLLVRRADGEMGWVVNTQCIVVNGNVFEAPLNTDVVMPIPGVTDGNLEPLVEIVEDGLVTEAAEEVPAEPVVELPLPNADVVCTNYIRSAANNESARLAILYPQDGPLEILARDQPAAWLLIKSQTGLMGWVVNTSCIQVNGNVFDAVQDTSMIMNAPQPGDPLPFPGATPPTDWPPQQ